MPMVVELVVAMLACVRIGAVHSIVVSITFVFKTAENSQQIANRYNTRHHRFNSGQTKALLAATRNNDMEN